jgi:putative transposase
MPKSTAWRRSARRGVAGRALALGPRVRPAASAPSLSRTASVRLEMLDWHDRHGRCVARTARHFGFSRTTVYRWLARYDRHRLESLEDRSSRPRRRRRPTWTLAELVAVRRVRLAFPRWGKDKLAIVLRREGIHLSVSMVGRILARLRDTGELREPPQRRISARKRAWRRPHAVRKPRELVPLRPGDLVQVDTLDVRPLPGQVFKQFTARDVVSRWDVLELSTTASARSAVAILDALAARMPFPVRAISVDNGSEFMAAFEQACADRGIALYTLPPRSPKLNGSVERANGTHTTEFYEVTDAEPSMAGLRPALLAWEAVYNTVRPHQALGYLTPAEYLASLEPDV